MSMNLQPKSFTKVKMKADAIQIVLFSSPFIEDVCNMEMEEA